MHSDGCELHLRLLLQGMQEVAPGELAADRTACSMCALETPRENLAPPFSLFVCLLAQEGYKRKTYHGQRCLREPAPDCVDPSSVDSAPPPKPAPPSASAQVHKGIPMSLHMSFRRECRE